MGETRGSHRGRCASWSYAQVEPARVCVGVYSKSLSGTPNASPLSPPPLPPSRAWVGRGLVQWRVQGGHVGGL